MTFLFFFLVPPPRGVDAQAVEIYGRHEESRWGRTVDRSVIETFTRADFLESPLAANQAGYLTALTLNREAALILAALTDQENPLVFASLRLERLSPLDPAEEEPREWRYHLVSEDDRFEIEFSLLRPPEKVLDEIRRTYGAEPEVGRRVLLHYGDSYIIRVFRGPDFNRDGRFDFREALTAATLLGDGNQWLWGIRDGADYLAPLVNRFSLTGEGRVTLVGEGGESSVVNSPRERPSEGMGPKQKNIWVVPGFIDDEERFEPLPVP